MLRRNVRGNDHGFVDFQLGLEAGRCGPYFPPLMFDTRPARESVAMLNKSGITVVIKPKLPVGAEDSTITGIGLSWQPPVSSSVSMIAKEFHATTAGPQRRLVTTKFGFHSALDGDPPSSMSRSHGIRDFTGRRSAYFCKRRRGSTIFRQCRSLELLTFARKHFRLEVDYGVAAFLPMDRLDRVMVDAFIGTNRWTSG
jgi:hypothetical protein